MESVKYKEPSILDAALPLVVLIFLLSLSVYLFGNDSSFGPNQIALFIAAAVGVIIGLKNGYSWADIEKAIIKGISLALVAVLILFSVGALIGTWLLSGTVPTMIYYGLQVISPNWFYTTACILCCMVSMSIGSSWTTAATIGVALMGVATGLGLSPAITAGAIVSGAYFGDKLSPLSETTNLSSAVVGVDVFEHIRHMLWTTVPSILLALLLFTIIGQNIESEINLDRIDTISTVLEQHFSISWISLIPLLILLLMAISKVPVFPTVFFGALLGGIWAVLFQPALINSLIDTELPYAFAVLKLIWTAMFEGFALDTGNADLDSLLNGGGMASMMNTVWLIICAMMFGAVIEKVGLLKRIVQAILHYARSTGSLISSTIATCFVTNILTADQYMSIVMPGRMYKEEYERRNLSALNLSRSLEDGGTITSPLIPWNTCGAYMHGVLQVNPLDYAFYAFFNLINPVLAVIYGYLGVKILRLSPAPVLTAEKAVS